MSKPMGWRVTTLLVIVFVLAGAWYYVGRTTSTVSTVTVTATTVSTTTRTVATTVRSSEGASWQVCFSPRGGCASMLIAWFEKANSSIHVMIYSFTKDDLAAALVRAKNRGVEVRVVVNSDQRNARGGEYPVLVAAGIGVRVDERSGLMHNKVAIVDGSVTATGSYNWSDAAENTNRENLVILKDPVLAAKYEENFGAVWEASRP